MRLRDYGQDFMDHTGYNGRAYYKLTTITWSKPQVWDPRDRCFPVPVRWAGYGGVYAFTRQHWRQSGKPRIAYIGKAKSFTGRLTSAHNHFGIIRLGGDTLVSCGRIAFERVKSRVGYYLEIEDIIKFAVHDHLANKQGFESLPGFWSTQARPMTPWVILNTKKRLAAMT